MQGDPVVVVIAKVIGLTAVAGLAMLGLTGWRRDFALGVCLAVAAFSVGTNIATLY